MFSITWPSAWFASIQPTRQPVIAQFFENVLTKIRRSSGRRSSRNDGASGP
jgi:hypothetical protein